MLHAIDKIIQHQLKTNTYAALKYMREGIFNSARSGVQKIGMVITDGESNIDKHLTLDEAKKLKDSNVDMFAIGKTYRLLRI